MAKQDPYAALRIREFNIFLFVRFLLVFGWSMQFIVIEWQVYSITKDPLSLGIIGLMEIIPAFSMALFAGHIVDQKEKRNLLALCTAAFSLISLGLFLLTSDEVVNGWSTNSVLYCIYGLVFFGGFLRSFFGPTIFSLVALLVPKKIYHNAATWSTSTWKTASVSGALCGGFFISWIDVDNTLLLVFILVILSLIFTFLIKKKPILNKKIGEPITESLKAGVKFVFSNKAVLGALTLDMIAVLFGGTVAILSVFAQDILEVGPEGFGLLNASISIGSIVTMLLTTYIPINKNTGKKMLISVFIFGLSIIAFGLSSIFWVSLLALFVSGAADGISMVIRQTILQLKTPDEMRGRVSSVNSMFVGSSNELGAFESGLAAKILGPVAAVVFGGTMTIITVATTAVVSPTIRNLDLTADIEENEKED
ncbi:MFS transporter [Polaribacter dokdonensis]|uniref:Multidrug efflux pump Tap n=1 Tax=Polaribacter dokdonensis DSW-5 TaxID=1300348 RepID=A0A0N0CFC5_9FLAO|nr:MFS transporter [Polaribacter dokdonensis]KOY51647.1 Major facilitator superfamily protein [Polaribacter dokdonensis DSW-5]SEE06402.1 Predicted arabinose efflux permease, MFS family [Polaribacter dokdonensis DSW-5]